MKRTARGNIVGRPAINYPDFSEITSGKETRPDAVYVPWKNQGEWLDVRQKIFSTKIEDVRNAVGKISAWNAKCASNISAGALCTAFLWRAKLQDVKLSEGYSQYDKNEISSIYAMAIMRFVNLVSDLGKTAKGGYRLDIAESMNIPGWIVQMRHEAAHSTMPSYDRLRKGADICLDWLRLNYWEKEEKNLMDYGTGKVRLVTDIGNEEETIQEYLREFQTAHFEFIYNRRRQERFQIYFKLTQLQYMFHLNVERFTSIFTESGFLILRYHHLDAILKSEEKDYLHNESVCLPRSLERFWFPVIEIYNTNPESFNQLIVSLLQTRHDQLEQRVATSWALHLLEISVNLDKSDLKVPPFLRWKELLTVALKNPNNYCTSILKIIAEKVQINQTIKNCLMGLVAIQLGTLVDALSFPNVTSRKGKKKKQKIYTVEDLKLHVNRKFKIKHNVPKGPWKIADDVDWKQLPIGISPDDIQLEKKNEALGLKITEIVDEPEAGASLTYFENQEEGCEHEPEPVYDVEDDEDADMNETISINQIIIPASKSVVAF